jgi:hypothetical protein
MRGVYADTLQSKRYIDNVVSGMEPLKDSRRPVAFVDGTVPSYINPLGGETARHAVLLYALGYRVRFYEPRLARRRKDVYRISDTGVVERYSRR